MSKRAIILAGGMGTRLKPYTIAFPKPLLPIGDTPILNIIIKQLVSQNFEHITIAVNHQADIIKAFFNNGEKWGVKIDYSLERKPLGTMGPLKILKNLPENFLVMNGDILTDLNFGNFYDEHIKMKNEFTISSFKRKQKVDFGVLDTDSNQNLLSFKEKPINTFEVSMGIYMINKKIIKFIDQNVEFGFDNLMYKLLSKNKKVKVSAFSGYWLDIGRPDDYKKANEDFKNLKNKFF